MRNLTNIAIDIGALALVLSSCVKGPKLFKQDGSTSVTTTIAAVEDSDGVVTGQFSAASSTTQTLSASSSGEIAGSQVAFPAGALAINTNITIEQGISFAGANTGSSLGIGNVDAAGPSVVITSSEAIDAGSPFTLQIPTSGTSLALADDTDSRTVVLFKYKVAAEGKSYLGIIPRDQIEIKNGYVTFETKYFGAYQVSVTETVVTEVKRIESDVPIVTKAAEKKLEPIVWNIGKGSYLAAKHEVRYPLSVSGFTSDVMCAAFVHENKSSGAIFVDTTDGYEPFTEINDYDYRLDLNSKAMTIYVRFECTGRDGRHSLSQWSEGIAVPKGPGTASGTNNGLADPGNLTVASYSRVTLNVTWAAAPSASVVGYRVAYSTGTHPSSCVGATNFYDIDGGYLSARVRELTPGTEYYFRICSKDTNGTFSNGALTQGHTDATVPAGISCSDAILDTSCVISDLSSATGNLIISGAGDLTLSSSVAYNYDLIIDMTGDVNIVGTGFAVSGHKITIDAENVNILAPLKSYDEYTPGSNGGMIDIFAQTNIFIDAAMEINASGTDGTSGLGGDGGSIFLNAETLSLGNSAAIKANGGIGGSIGLDGGIGGYIDIAVYSNGGWSEGTGNYIQANGGVGGPGGGSAGGDGGDGGSIIIPFELPTSTTCSVTGGLGGTGTGTGVNGIDGTAPACGGV